MSDFDKARDELANDVASLEAETTVLPFDRAVERLQASMVALDGEKGVKGLVLITQQPPGERAAVFVVKEGSARASALAALRAINYASETLMEEAFAEWKAVFAEDSTGSTTVDNGDGMAPAATPADPRPTASGD